MTGKENGRRRARGINEGAGHGGPLQNLVVRNLAFALNEGRSPYRILSSGGTWSDFHFQSFALAAS